MGKKDTGTMRAEGKSVGLELKVKAWEKVCVLGVLVVAETVNKTFGVDILDQKDPLMFLNNRKGR